MAAAKRRAPALVACLCALAWILAGGGSARAFVLPSDVPVGAGSVWEYRSNLGRTVVRMLEREELGDDLCRYTWDMQVFGLRYTEGLELTPARLTARWRHLSGFGLFGRRFEFAVPELILALPLEVGREWEWTGPVQSGKETKTAYAAGRVVARQVITVPAGTFETYHILLERTDEFGTRQQIELWFDPQVGPIKAVGDLRWRGAIGLVQDLVGLHRFEVELLAYKIEPPERQEDSPH